jgi:hypothetical protein
MERGKEGGPGCLLEGGDLFLGWTDKGTLGRRNRRI